MFYYTFQNIDPFFQARAFESINKRFVLLQKSKVMGSPMNNEQCNELAARALETSCRSSCCVAAVGTILFHVAVAVLFQASVRVDIGFYALHFRRLRLIVTLGLNCKLRSCSRHCRALGLLRELQIAVGAAGQRPKLADRVHATRPRPYTTCQKKTKIECAIMCQKECCK